MAQRRPDSHARCRSHRSRRGCAGRYTRTLGIRKVIAAFAACTLAAGAACTPFQGRPTGSTEFWGFTAPWDPRSPASVAAHQDALDVVITGWIALDSASFRPVALFPDPAVANNKSNRRYMALVTSYHGSRFRPETLRGLTEDSLALARAAGAVGTLAGAAGYRGIVLDFEGMTPDDLGVLLEVTKSFADSARAHGVGPIGLAIPATDTAAYPARPLLLAVDFLVVMLYDQHWLTSPPGPIAAPDWARRQLGVRIGEVGPDKLVAALPAYGYQWRSDSATAVVSYDDARRLAAEAHTTLARDPASMTLHANTDVWNIWVSDAVLLDTLVRDARTLGVTKFALWRLGLEDPALWTNIAAH